MGPRVTQNWDAFLTPRDGISGPGRGPAACRHAPGDGVVELLEHALPALVAHAGEMAGRIDDSLFQK